jgi:hypothetical protein
LNGYRHGKRDDIIINTEQLDQDTQKITPLMQAAETVIGQRN